MRMIELTLLEFAPPRGKEIKTRHLLNISNIVAINEGDGKSAVIDTVDGKELIVVESLDAIKSLLGDTDGP